MAQSKANCKFCSRTDNSIQVICETRCLICSRCQLMPGIRKLLIDHSNIKDATSIHMMSGCCPICESAMSPGMLGLISTFNESFKKLQNEDNPSIHKMGAEIELEEVSTIITTFLKRFRATYEADGKLTDKEGKEAAAVAASSAYDSHNVPTKATTASVLEFILECYHAQWQSVLRNCNESMVTIMMRMTVRKKFSQRTNDFKAKSLVDFMSSSSSGCETSDLLLFGRLTGLQPKPTCNISAAWSHIAISIIVAAHCDRCLKFGQLNDVTGNPSANELRQKMSRSAVTPRSISLKKAIKIVALLSKAQHPYWTLSPLAPACIEYSCKLPWRDDSISKILNVLFFVALFDPGTATPSASATGVGNRRTSTASSLPSINGASSPSTPLGKPTTPHGTFDSSLFADGSAPLDHSNARRSVLKSSGVDFAAISTVGADQFGGNAAAAQAAYRHNARIQMLKNLDGLSRKVWGGTVNALMSTSSDKYVILDFMSKIASTRSPPSFARLSFDKALSLAEGHTILVSELALVCIECWEQEYVETKAAIAKGMLTSKRRMAISGSYDPSRAKLNAVERLALTRLLHWYSVDGECRGVDWEDVDERFQERAFPFTVPASLMLKSRNELNYLSDVVWREVLVQQAKDQDDDLAAQDGPYSLHSAGVRTDGTSQLVFGETRSADDYVTVEEIERYNREQYLASQTIGYAGPAFDGYVDEETVAQVEKSLKFRSYTMKNLPGLHHHHHHSHHHTVKSSLKRSATSAEALGRDSAEILERVDGLSLRDHESSTLGGFKADTLSPDTTSDVTQQNRSRPKTPLSRLPYESPAPGPHAVNIVDVIGVGGNVLSNARLVANNHHGSQPSPRRTETKKESVTIRHDDEDEHVRNAAQEEKESSSSRAAETDDSPETAVEKKYSAVHKSHYNNKVLAARSRIRTRIETLERRGVETHVMPSGEKSLLTPEEESLNYLINNCRITPVLSLKEFVDRHGAFTLDLATHLSSETAVRYLALRNANISVQGFQYVADHYLKTWQLSKMVRIDLDGNAGLAVAGAKVLAAKLATSCCLVHLNLSGTSLGDTGLRAVLQGMLKGGGAPHLLRLDLSSNGISMVSDSVELVGEFLNLKALDLSKNCFTLDTTVQRSTFHSAMAPLANLEALSLAHNKIQNDGFSLVCTLVSESLHSLRQLDVAFCFISSKSYPSLVALLELATDQSTDAAAPATENNSEPLDANAESAAPVPPRISKLEEVMFQQNLLSHALLQDLHNTYGARADLKVVLNMPHLGIGFPLRYDLRDFGIESYHL